MVVKISPTTHNKLTMNRKTPQSIRLFITITTILILTPLTNAGDGQTYLFCCTDYSVWGPWTSPSGAETFPWPSDVCGTGTFLSYTHCWPPCTPPNPCPETTTTSMPSCSIDRICPSTGAWYGLVNISKYGAYVSGSSQGFGSDKSAQDPACFARKVRVCNDGSISCLQPAGCTIKKCLIPAGAVIDGTVVTSNIETYLLNQSFAFSGYCNVLGEPVQKVWQDALGNPQISSDFGDNVVVDKDYIFIGLDEESYAQEEHVIRQQEQPNLGEYADQLCRDYYLSRKADLIDLIGTSFQCKNERLFPIDQYMYGATKDNVYGKNIEKAGFSDCLWFVIDGGKFCLYPGLYIVLLNRSKFGASRGFSFYSVLGQEDVSIDHIYDESVVPGYYLGGYSRITTDHWSNYTMLDWNWDSGLRILGCDACDTGDSICSMGAALADWWNMTQPRSSSSFPGNGRPESYGFPEQTCGYYSWRKIDRVVESPYSKVCDCTTGYLVGAGLNKGKNFVDCSSSSRDICKERGYYDEVNSDHPPLSRPYHDVPEDTGKPDENLVRYSIDSIQSEISAYFINETKWNGQYACGHNTGDNPSDANAWAGSGHFGDGLGCTDPRDDSVTGCSAGDCKVPWNKNAASAGGDWDYANRAGGVDIKSFTRKAVFTKNDYLSDVEPKKCSDYNYDEPPTFGNRPYDTYFYETAGMETDPTFGGDRYTMCDSGTTTTSTTMPPCPNTYPACDGRCNMCSLPSSAGSPSATAASGCTCKKNASVCKCAPDECLKDSGKGSGVSLGGRAQVYSTSADTITVGGAQTSSKAAAALASAASLYGWDVSSMTAEQRFQAVFEWITGHMNYMYDFSDGSPCCNCEIPGWDCSNANDVWLSGEDTLTKTPPSGKSCGDTYCGDCDDFAHLFISMVRSAGVSEDCVAWKIGPSHAFNAVKIKGNWEYVDCTLANTAGWTWGQMLGKGGYTCGTGTWTVNGHSGYNDYNYMDECGA